MPFALFDDHLVADCDRARLYYPGKDTLARHDAVAHLLIYLAVTVALLAYLRHLKQHVAASEQSSDGQRAKIKALDHEVFAKRAGNNVCSLFVEGSDFIGAQQTYLSVPFTGVCIAVNAPFGCKVCAFYVAFLQSLAFACTHRDYFSHVYPPIWLIMCCSVICAPSSKQCALGFR